MASGDDVLGALLLQRRHISPEKLSWAIGEMVREHRRGGQPDLQFILSKHKLVVDEILRQVGYQARTGGSTFDLDFQSLDWMRQTMNKARAQFGVPQRPATRTFPSGANHRATLGITEIPSSPEDHQQANRTASRRRPTSNRFQLNAQQAAGMLQSARSPGHMPATQTSGQTPSNILKSNRGNPNKVISVSRQPAAKKKQNKVWGRYEIDKEIGRGAMGAVYRAYDLEQDRREVAIKVLLQGNKAHGDILERFHREARTLARLKHPAIVRVLDNGIYQSRAYIAMEFVAGTPMDEMIKDIPLTRGLVIWEEIANALSHAHSVGVVHRDLKPANILITTDGKPKIMDFGLAKLLDESNTLTRQGDLVGTPLYMSPEQIRGDLTAMGPMCDLWGFGVGFYLFLTDKLPFHGKTVEEVAKKVRDVDPSEPHTINQNVPEDLSNMCMTLLHKDTAHRYQRAEDIAADIRLYLQGESLEFGARPAPTGKPLLLSKPLLIAILSTLVIAIGLGATYIVTSKQKQERRESWIKDGKVLRGLSNDAMTSITKMEREISCSVLQADTYQQCLKQLQDIERLVKRFEASESKSEFPSTVKKYLTEARTRLASLRSLDLIAKLTPELSSQDGQLTFKAKEVGAQLAVLENFQDNLHYRWARLCHAIRVKKDFKLVDAYLADLHKDFPSQGVFYFISGDIQETFGKLDKAVDTFTEGLRNVNQRSARFALYLKRSRLHQKLSQITEAHDDLKRALKNGFRYETERIQALQRIVELQTFDMLSKVIEGLSEEDSSKPIYQLPRAMEWLERDCPAQALLVLERAHESDSSVALKALRYWFKAKATYALFDHEAALKEVKATILTADNANLINLSLEAQALYIRLLHIVGEFDHAEDVYKSALKRYPKKRGTRVRYPNPKVGPQWIQVSIPAVPVEERDSFSKILLNHGDALLFQHGPATISMNRTNSFREVVRYDKETRSIGPYLQALHLPYNYSAVHRRLALYAITNLQVNQGQKGLFDLHNRELSNDQHASSLVVRALGLRFFQESAKTQAERLYSQARKARRSKELQHCHNYILLALDIYKNGQMSRHEATKLQQVLKRACILEPGDPLNYKYYRRYWSLREKPDSGLRYGSVSHFLDNSDPDNYFWYALYNKARAITNLKVAEQLSRRSKSGLSNHKRTKILRVLAKEESRHRRLGKVALNHAKQALQGNENDLTTLNLLISLCKKYKQRDKEKEYTRILREAKEKGLDQLQEAQLSFDQGDYKKALRLITRARVYLPQSAMSHYQRLRGETQIMIKAKTAGDSDSWLSFCKSASHDLGHAEALLRAARLGDSPRRQELFNMAKSSLSRIEDSSQLAAHRFAVAYQGFALMLTGVQNKQISSRVELEFKNLLIDLPSALGVRLIRASYLILIGATADARQELERLVLAQKWDKNTADDSRGGLLHACLALSLIEMEQRKAAIEALEKARGLGFEVNVGPQKLFESPRFQSLLKE
jgi:serine/threonine protein kinase